MKIHSYKNNKVYGMSVIKIAIAVLRHPNILSYKRNSDNFCKGSAGVCPVISQSGSGCLFSALVQYTRLSENESTL